MNNLNTTCFNIHKEKNKQCQTTSCRYWHKLSCSQNCMINKINENKDMTLQEIGDMFNVTRMRVCQIEKKAVGLLKDKLTPAF